MAGKAIRAVWHAVKCKAHGRNSQDPNIPPEVAVGSKGTRAERQGRVGCPDCKREKKAAATKT